MNTLEEIKKQKEELKELIKRELPTAKDLKIVKSAITFAVNEVMAESIKQTYNKRYYEKHRQKILENASKKAVCELCGRSVIKYNLTKHYELPICKKIQKKNKLIEERKNEIIENV